MNIKSILTTAFLLTSFMTAGAQTKYLNVQIDDGQYESFEVTPDLELSWDLKNYEENPPQVLKTVDLGLESGAMWATCNLGATKPWETGDYYAWAETEPYYTSLDPLTWKEDKPNGYYYTMHRYNNPDMKEQLIKYNFEDEKYMLEPEDDPVSCINPNYHTATADDWVELVETCYWVFCDGEETKYQGTSAKGFIVYKRHEDEDQDALNDNRNRYYMKTWNYSTCPEKYNPDTCSHIFIPVGGGFYNWTTCSYKGNPEGWYWTSERSTSYGNVAWNLYFSKDRIECQTSYQFAVGMSIRAVCSPSSK